MVLNIKQVSEAYSKLLDQEDWHISSPSYICILKRFDSGNLPYDQHLIVDSVSAFNLTSMEHQFNAQHITSKNKYGLIVAIIAWISVTVQFCVGHVGIINFFSYFTILCNLLIAISLTFSILLAERPAGKFFAKLSVQSAIALYIFIVSLVYNVALRGIVTLSGLAWAVDNMLHVAVPMLYLLFWFFYKAKGTLQWKDGIYWAIFPLCYLFYSLIRGAVTQWYPYPFLNAAKFGYPTVMINISVMLAVYLIAGFILIAITRRAGATIKAGH
jgi:hypothetical protein